MMIRKITPFSLIGVVSLLLCDSAPGQTSVTIDATSRRFIGGTGVLDRAQYFNYWGQATPGTNTNLGNLETEVYSPTGLHAFSGRETNDFLVAMQLQSGVEIPEDPNRPGFFDRNLLVGKLQNNTDSWGYKYRVLQSTRFDSLRNAPNPIYVTSGRKGVYPDLIDGGTDMVTNYAGYADFLNVYLEEVVYGTGPGQGYLPFDKNRFYIEIMNEPSWQNDAPWSDVIEFHRTVTELVKAEHPQANIGGASVGNFVNGTGLARYDWSYAKQLMDDMADPADPWSSELDFWTFHPYDARGVNSSGVVEHSNPESSGHLDAMLDLFESYSYEKFGDPKKIAVTEYGTIQFSRYNGGDYSPYPRRLLQWDELTDVKKKLMTFMDRPDRIINATPFLAPKWYTNSTPTEHGASANVFWDRNADGTWTETVAAGFFRMLNDVQGDYLDIASNNSEVQVAGFRDGDQLHVILNNLSESSQSINLSAFLNGASVSQATLDRVFWNGSTGVYQNDLNVLGGWQNLVLSGEEAVKLTLTTSQSLGLFSQAIDRRTHYGDVTQTPINLPGATSEAVNIVADLEDALFATARIAISGRTDVWNESFSVVVNGNAISVPARGPNGFDENDNSLFSREIDVPLAFLNDGANQVYVDFNSSGGDLVTATLMVTRSVGDFNGSGAFDAGDLSDLYQNFGPADAGSRYDLVEDGVIDMADINYWIEELRGAAFLAGDYNFDGEVNAVDYAVWREQFGGDGGLFSADGTGDDLAGLPDGDVDIWDYNFWKANYGATVANQNAEAHSVPEPTAVWTALFGLSLAVARLRQS